jgi:hypothetical protein
MSKVVEMNGRKENRPRAPAVAAKLEAATAARQALEGEIGQAALDATEDAPGAAKRLAALRSQIADAEREVDELTKAHELAVRLDRIARVEGATAIRASQLAAFQGYMRERDAATAEICEAAAKMAAAYRRYTKSTLKMLGVKPIGTAVPVMGIGPDALCGSAIGSLEVLISVELFRCSANDADGQRYVVPFGKPLSRTSDDPGAIPPAIEMFREAQAAMLSDVKAQVEKIDAEDLAKATGAAA